jgi:hypothetical protein
MGATAAAVAQSASEGGTPPAWPGWGPMWPGMMGGFGRPGMMGWGMGPEMMERMPWAGGPHREMTMKVMFAIADTDGDGALSFQEVEAIHKRVFDTIDANKDGKVTPEEVQAFLQP